jgi:ribosomal protein S18 acetylase RimI-like enzyme
MENSIRLRAANDGDLPFLKRLYASTRQRELQLLDWSQEEKQQFLQQQFAAQDQYYHEQFPDCSFQIVTLGMESIGRLYLDRRKDEFRIVDIALLPEHRGQGIGRRLMEQILREAGERKLPVRIHVEQDNPALRLYESLGFCRLGEVGVYFFMEYSGGM